MSNDELDWDRGDSSLRDMMGDFAVLLHDLKNKS